MTDFMERRRLQVAIQETYAKIAALVESGAPVGPEMKGLVGELGALLTKQNAQKDSVAEALGYETTAADDGASNDD